MRPSKIRKEKKERKEQFHTKQVEITDKHFLSSPVIQVGALGPVQRVGGAVSCYAAVPSENGGTRAASQAVDHGLGQLCLLYHLLDVLQLLVVGPPPGG